MYYNEKLDKIINEIAEVAGYLWEKGWAERNRSEERRVGKEC